jgi:DNA polymerase
MESSGVMNDGNVTACDACDELTSCRSQIVNGVGPDDASLLLVGEAPGNTEDETGEPFTGRSGEVLNSALENAGIQRTETRITNCVRCHPPENRDPHVAERENCLPHLLQEVAFVNPEVIIPLGRIPCEQLTQEPVTVSEDVGEIRSLDTQYSIERTKNTTVILSVHPAATLYDNSLQPEFNRVFQIAAGKLSN